MSKLVFLRKAGYGTSLRDYGFNTVKPNQSRKFEQLNPNIIWRWGYSGLTSFNWPTGVGVINNSSAIVMIGAKYQLLDRLSEDDSEVRVPHASIHKELFWHHWNTDSNTVILGRKFSHFGGRDIKVLKTKEELDLDTESDFWVKFIPKTREYRIYSFFGRIIEVQEKIPEDINAIAWNHSQGSHFINVRYDNWPLNAIKKVLKAVKLTGIDYCAWDVILGKDHKYYLLEGNTAPSITGEYNLSIMSKCVTYLEDYYDEFNSIPNHFDLVNNGESWRDFIHPLMLDSPEEE